MNDQELLHAIALTFTPGISRIVAKKLYDCCGSAVDVFASKGDIAELNPQQRPLIAQALASPLGFKRAEEELAFAEMQHIRCLIPTDENYPFRLKECSDAPLVLFYRGMANLNALHMISVVGTRHATDYGREVCEKLMRDLAVVCPDTVVVSGLAYGIDICAHSAALAVGLPTIGVLAHGHDRIYPALHRNTAREMLEQGGLLTEFPIHTNPDKINFVQRNRIVAGISEATVVVESASKGGALITADMANGYNRECFAIPGKIFSTYSEGCNQLIQDNKAALLTSATDLLKALKWDVQATPSQKPIQRQLFVNLTEDMQKVVAVLQPHEDGVEITDILQRTNIQIGRLNGILVDMEEMGVVRMLAGNFYKLIQ